MIDAGQSLPEQVAGHEARNRLLVRRLVEMGVDPSIPRAIDLFFFMPTPEAAQALAARLQLRGFQSVAIDPRVPGNSDDSRDTSLTISILETVDAVTDRSYIAFLVEAAARLRGLHDGWGTSVAWQGPDSTNDAAFYEGPAVK